MNEMLDNLKENFFKVFIEWANGQYALQSHSKYEHTLDLQYDILDAQPINTVMTIGNQTVHRLFLPTNESIINYDVHVTDDSNKGITAIADFDIYIQLKSGHIIENVTGHVLKHNLIYIIPAGQYFRFTTTTGGANYFMTLKKTQDSVVTVNQSPTELKSVSFQ